MGLVVVVSVLRVLDSVLHQLHESLALAYELNQLRDAASATEHGELLFFKKKFFNGATFLLVEELLDLHVASVNESKRLSTHSSVVAINVSQSLT